MRKFALIGCSLLALSSAASAEDIRPFTSLDIFDLEYVSDMAVSPDGKRIIYARRANNIMTDRTDSDLWIVDADGDNNRPLLTGAKGYRSPVWSPGGDRIAYVSSTEDGRSAIFVRWMDTGQTATVAVPEKSPSSITWSPDGNWIAFTMSVDGSTKPLAKAPKKPKGATWSDPVKVIDAVRYRADGRGFFEPAYTHIFVVPALGGTPRQLTQGNFNHGGPLSWSPDSAKIYFSANRHETWEYETVEEDIFSVTVADGTLTQITDDPGMEASPQVSPDGRWIAYSQAVNEPKAYWPVRLNVMRADGSGKRSLTDSIDSRVGNVQWAGSRKLYFQYDERAVRKVASVTLNGNIETQVPVISATSIGRPYLSGTYDVSDNGVVAFTRGSATRPADLYVQNGRRAKRLTRLNEDLLAHRDLGQVNEINYKSSLDGTPIQGWYITPPGFDPAKKYPLIVEIHGGPHLAYGPYFSAELQRFAAEGYVVFYDNHRGSSSYGTDFALKLQYKYSSKDDFADHMSGIDAMVKQGFVDEDNLFIAGGSAGGIATAYAVGLTDRFKAAAAAKPVINWVSKTLTADSSIGQIRHQFPAMPWEDYEHYWKRSPLSLVGNVKTPTMLITGEEDQRTPISETEQFYQALKLRKVDTVMVRVPGSPHGIAGRPSRMIAKVDNILAWFKRYRTDATEKAAEDSEEE